MSKREKFMYRPDGKVLRAFFVDRAPVSIIQGPVGSGTSTACCHKMWAISNEQQPNAMGQRMTRWIVVRNTFDELKQTTLKTWKYWFVQVAQKIFGDVKMSNPPEHNIYFDRPDGTTVIVEFIFLSLDNEDDVSKLTSMEATGVWFNEVQFTEKAIFDMAHSRAMQGRYPPKLEGGPTWKGVIADLNAPPDDHFVPYFRGEVDFPEDWDDAKRREYEKPDDWNFFIQPPGLIEVFDNGQLTGYVENTPAERIKRGLDPEDAAENMKWIDESYTNLIKGKSKAYIDTFVMNRVGRYQSGRPVFESFSPEVHVSKVALQYRPEWPLLVGMDFARNPAAVVCQLIRGQMFVLDEFGKENVTAGEFAPLFKQRIMQKFPGILQEKKVDLDRLDPVRDKDRLLATSANSKLQMFGDPTGGSRGQATNWTPYLIFAAHGMHVLPAPGNNDITLRLEAVTTMLNKMVGGGPALLLSNTCRTLNSGMSGKYHFAKVQGKSGRHHDTPVKDKYSDYCDALQYACLGAGLGMSALTGGSGAPKPSKRSGKKKYSLKGRR